MSGLRRAETLGLISKFRLIVHECLCLHPCCADIAFGILLKLLRFLSCKRRWCLVGTDSVSLVWKADAVNRVVDSLPLHKMELIDFIALKAFEYGITSQRWYRPVITLAFHLFPVCILPVNPCELRVRRNVLAQYDDREAHWPC